MSKDLYEYNDNNNLIHFKHSNNYYEFWFRYDEKNKYVYFKSSDGREEYYKHENNQRIEITKKEFEWIEFKEKEKEFNSRTPVSRFQLMEI